MTASENLGPDAAALRARVAEYLRAHHTMTVATAGAAVADATVGGVSRRGAAPASPVPVAHAASVFYAVDDQLRLVFLSKLLAHRHLPALLALGAILVMLPALLL